MDQSSPMFFFVERKRIVVDNAVFILSIALSVPEILSIKIWSCPKSRRIFNVVCPPKFAGAVSSKVVFIFSCLPRSTSRAKLREVIPLRPEVITANTLNFKPIFECSLLKIVGGTYVPGGVCPTKPWSFSSACKNLSCQRPYRGRKMVFRRKSIWLGPKSQSNCVVSGPKFIGLFCRARDESLSNTSLPTLDISLRSEEIHDRSLKLKFYTFLAPYFFGGRAPNFGTWIIKLNNFRTRGKVSRWSAEGAWRSCGQKRNNCSKTYDRREPPFQAAE